MKTKHKVFDLLFFPITFLCAWFFKKLRYWGLEKLPFTRSALLKNGIYPIRDHYFEPLFDPKHLLKPLSQKRDLPGIRWNQKEQLRILNEFTYENELSRFPTDITERREFYYNNNSFGPGDAEYLYCMIRRFKPRRVLEVGSGNSTLMVLNAANQNQVESSDYRLKVTCVEPYEADWLEKTGAEIIRKPVEQLDLRVFKELEKDDILFIDSSHMIRPQGDVLFLYLEVLPVLKPGVLVHVHDIFTPYDYLEDWICKEFRLWNEQYLLEAILSNGEQFEIVGALNYLGTHFPEELGRKLPVWAKSKKSIGSFWMRKV